MNQQEQVRGLARYLEKALSTLAHRSIQRPFLSLGLVLVISGAALFSARNLRIDTNLAALLPTTFESVRDVKRLQERFGALGYVMVLVEGENGNELLRFTDDLAKAASKEPEFSFAKNKRPDDFFRKHGLYYLTPDDLEEVSDRIQDRIRHEKSKVNPLFVDVTDGGPPSLDFSDILARYQFNQGSGLSKDRKEPHYVDRKAGQAVILLKPADRASKLSYSERIITVTQSLIAKLDPQSYEGGLKIRIGGRYQKFREQQARIGEDVRVSSWVALGLVFFYLLLHFRRLSSVILLLAPLGIGLLWVFGAAAAMFDALNILTAFAGAILLGLGIDHGIHLLHRFHHERRSGRSIEECVDRTFSNTGRAVVLAGTTTAIGFFAVAVSEFRAFREFGLLAGLGIISVVVSYTVVLPPLLVFLEKLGSFKGGAPKEAESLIPGLKLGAAPALFWICSVLAIGLGARGFDVEFDYDFAAMDGKEIAAYELDPIGDRLMGSKSTPIVVMCRADEEAEVAAALRKRQSASKDSAIDFVVAQADLVPPEQEEKLEVIEELAEDVLKVDAGDLPEEERDRLAWLKEMVQARPFTLEDLPDVIQKEFRTDRLKSAPEELQGVVLVYPRYTLSDGKRVLQMAKEVRGIELKSGRRISAAGEAMILADVLNMVIEESPRIVSYTLVLVFFALWVLIGRFRLALVCMLPSLITVVGALGLLPFLGVKLNYLNVVLVPVLFGIAVDAGIHMVLRGAGSGPKLLSALAETRGAILGSTLTTSMGFGALLLAHHPGLRSFGQVALCGLIMNLFASLLWLSGLLAMLEIRKRRLAEADLLPSLGGRIAGDIATVFGAGYAKPGPGTFGTIAALPAGWALSCLDWPVQVVVAVGCTVVAVVASRRYLAGATDSKDPSEIVADEFIGLLIALLFVPWSWVWVTAAFVLFRLLDILKPGPVGWADRGLKNEYGVVLDDAVAGLLTGLLLLAVRAGLERAPLPLFS